jgi:hypothetical protein
MPPSESVATLIARLGDASFEVRERAQRELVARGEIVRPAVLAAARDTDAEVRARAKQILRLLDERARAMAREALEKRLHAFVAETGRDGTYDLPDWPRYRALAGDTQGSRQLYAEMVRAEPDLLLAGARGSQEASQALTARLLELRAAMTNPLPALRQLPSTPAVAAVLFVASKPGARIGAEAGTAVYSLGLHNGGFRNAAGDKAMGGPLRKIMGAFVAANNEPDATLQYYKLTFGRTYELAETLTLAERMLSDPKNKPPAGHYTYIILTVAKLGNREHLRALEPLLGDRTVVQSTTTSGETATLEVRDLALAAAVHLTGQEVKDFGFPRAVANATLVFSPLSLARRKGEEGLREAGLEKWRRWQAAQPRVKGR